MLATRPTLSWKFLPFLISKALNNSISPKTGFRPAEMVLGAEAAGTSFLDLMSLAPPHYSVRSHKLYIEQLSAEFKLMTEVATKKLTELRIVQNERVNKNRVARNFKINDIVFVLDRTYTPGNPRVLRTTLSPSPYVVLRPLFKSTLVMRIADRFTSLYNNEDLKLFNGNSPLFQELPAEVLRALLYDFNSLMEQEFSVITKADALTVPTSVELFVPEKDNSNNTTANLGGSIDLFGSKPEEILDPGYLKSIKRGPVLPLDDDVPGDAPTTEVAPVLLEDQGFLDIPEEIQEDLEELQESEQVGQNIVSDVSEEEGEKEIESGRQLRSRRVTFT